MKNFYREESGVDLFNGNGRRNPTNQQTYRKLPSSSSQWQKTSVSGTSAGYDWSADEAARAAALAAAETARKLEADKARIQAEAKKREDELLDTIRKQQIQLKRFQQAAALAEQKVAKVRKVKNKSDYQSLLINKINATK